MSTFDHWLDSWFCSPHKPFGFQRLEYNFLYSEELPIYRRSRFYFTDFLLRQTKIPQQLLQSGLALRGGDVFGQREVLESFPALYSLLVHRLLPKRFYYKHPGPGVETFLENSNRGRCVRRDPSAAKVCECFCPYRGPLCQYEERRSEAFDAKFPTNQNKHVIYYLLDHGDDHLWELQHALQNLWDNFNRYFDYPVVIWHVGIDRDVELEFLNSGGAGQVLLDDANSANADFAAWRKKRERARKAEERRKKAAQSTGDDSSSSKAGLLSARDQISMKGFSSQTIRDSGLQIENEKQDREIDALLVNAGTPKTQVEAYMERREEEELFMREQQQAVMRTPSPSEETSSGRTKAKLHSGTTGDQETAAAEDEYVLQQMKRLAHFGYMEHNSEARVLSFRDADEFYEEAKAMRESPQPAGMIFYQPRGSRAQQQHKSVGADVKSGDPAETARNRISLLDIVARSSNRIWLHLREKPEMPILPNMDRDDHHRSYPWLEMIHFRSGPLYLTNVMQRFHLSWWLDTDAYFPNDAKGYDPFTDFEHKNNVLQDRSRRHFLRNHLEDFLQQVEAEASRAGVGRGEEPPRNVRGKGTTGRPEGGDQHDQSREQLRSRAKELFVDHVNEFVADLEMAWGYKILYRSARTAALQQLWEITNFWSLQHRHLMEHKLFNYPNRQLSLPMQQLNGPPARELREETKRQRRAKAADEGKKQKNAMSSSARSAGGGEILNKTDGEYALAAHETPEELDSGGKQSKDFQSLFDQVVVITFEYPQGNALSGACVMPNAITNSRYTGAPDTLYQRYVKYLNNLHGMLQIHGWGDHIVQTIGFAVLFRPLEVALNHTLVWNMTRLPYAHQHFVDCVGDEPVKVWDPDTGDIWEFRWRFERSAFARNKSAEDVIDREYNSREKYISMQQDDLVVRGTLNVDYLHFLPEKWNWRKPFFACKPSEDKKAAATGRSSGG
ncbi:unnamed protein product [Amoebophrya sp. A25]|nr:unnamed protein product [Amoebophrya sp. A25]|eukprot:GSA25T00025257001.1